MDAIPISQIDLKGLEIDVYRTSISGNAYISDGALLDLGTGRAYVVKSKVVELLSDTVNYIYYDIRDEEYVVSEKLLKNLHDRKLLFIVTKHENGSVDNIINATDIKNRDLTLPNISDQVYSTDTEYNLEIVGDKIAVQKHKKIKRVEELYIHSIGVVLSKSIVGIQDNIIIIDGDEMSGKLCDVSYFW
jgi:hypothetical protein